MSAVVSRASVEIREQLRALPPQQVHDVVYEASSPVHPDVTVERIDVGGRPAEWIRPTAGDDGAVLMYLHGGGYVGPYNAGYRRMLSHLAATSSASVFAPTYRLAGEAPFPAAVEDAVTAYHWLLDRGVEPARVVVGGDSAGAGLTVATLVTLVGQGVPLPNGAVLISPWVDLEGVGGSMTSAAHLDPFMTYEGDMGCAVAYAGGEDLRHPLVSPIHAELQGLPPLLVVVGGHEILLDDAIRLVGKAAAAGVDVRLHVAEGMWHIYPIHVGARDTAEVSRAIADLAAFIRDRCAP